MDGSFHKLWGLRNACTLRISYKYQIVSSHLHDIVKVTLTLFLRYSVLSQIQGPQVKPETLSCPASSNERGQPGTQQLSGINYNLNLTSFSLELHKHVLMLIDN